MNFRPIVIFSLLLFILTGPTRLHAQAAQMNNAIGRELTVGDNSVKETEQLDFAQGLLSRGMYDLAISQCQKFIAQYPHSPSLQAAYLSLGEGYFLSQDFKNAVDTFNQFIQLFPNSDQLPVGILRLGQIDIQQKDYDEAIKELNSID